MSVKGKGCRLNNREMTHWVKSLFEEINALCQGQRVDIAFNALAYEFAMILGKSCPKMQHEQAIREFARQVEEAIKALGELRLN